MGHSQAGESGADHAGETAVTDAPGQHRGKRRAPRRFITGLVITGAVFGLLGGLAAWPVAMKAGVNFHVTVRRVPLAVKVMTFLVRDYEYYRLATEITRGCTTDAARASAICAWTQQHIRPTPREWPVIDDHIYHIIIRGYGEADQAADVFTTLTAYAGVPAFWKIVRARAGEGKIVLSFARIDGRWTVWDIRRVGGFRNVRGDLAELTELRTAPELAERILGRVALGGQDYRVYVEDGLASWARPESLRAEQQMPARRLLVEVRRAWHRLWRAPDRTDLGVIPSGGG